MVSGRYTVINATTTKQEDPSSYGFPFRVLVLVPLFCCIVTLESYYSLNIQHVFSSYDACS